MLKLAFPSVCGMLLRNTVDILNYIVIGRLGDPNYISGIGLAYIISTIASTAVVIGLTGGVETLSSQAFGNKKNYLAGWYYRRAQVILTIIFIPQAIFLYFSSSMLILVGMPKISSEYAELFSK